MTQKFGAYEILHELSSGGMGAVLLGRRRGPGAFEQLVAIKTIKPEYAQAAAVRAMFLDEAAILARLAHPGIATVHDFGDQDGALYMVMEYVAGNSFRSLIDGPMPPAVAARAVAEACRGLHAAHEVRDTSGALLGVVHRDISPDNLMLGFDGHVKVIDFGIALVKNRQAPVTEFGTVKGKPPYMSPEQVKNEAIDRRSDVFSLGVVLHEMLTGRALFDGDSIYAIARAVEHQPIASPSAVTGVALPAGLDAAVMHALDRDLSRRTPTAAQFAEELERVIGAAGGETLESWAERELAPAREAHRSWIAGVIAGRDAPKPKVGRATGAVTAVGAEALAALNLQPVGDTPAKGIDPRGEASPDTAGLAAARGIVPRGEASLDTADLAAARGIDPRGGVSREIAGSNASNARAGQAKTAPPASKSAGAYAKTAIPASKEPDEIEPPRRSLALPIIGLLVIATAIVAVIAMIRRSSTTARSDADIVSDAGIVSETPASDLDARGFVEGDASLGGDASVLAEVDARADVLIDASPPIDATVLVDAGRRVPVDAGRRAMVDAGPRVMADAGRTMVDARVAAPSIDAAPSGTGIVNFQNPPGGGSVMIILDGKNIGPTPSLNREVPAGTHTVEFVGVDKTTKETFELAPGEKKGIRPPPQ